MWTIELCVIWRLHSFFFSGPWLLPKIVQGPALVNSDYFGFCSTKEGQLETKAGSYATIAPSLLAMFEFNVLVSSRI